MKHLLGLLQYNSFDVSITIFILFNFSKKKYNNFKFYNEEFLRAQSYAPTVALTWNI